MSALRIVKLKTKGSNKHYCQGAFVAHKQPKSGAYRATILDYDAGLVCAACKKEWEAAWDGCFNNELEEAA